MTDTRTVRPGLLVVLKTRIDGGVDYESETLEAPHPDGEDQKAIVSEWKTRKTVADAEQFAVAKDVRSQCRGKIVNVCAATAFGLLCPLDREDDLRAGVMEANTIASKWNSTNPVSRVVVNVLIGRVEQDDVAAVKAISDEVSQLLLKVEKGIADQDPEEIGKNCDKLRDIGTMLEPEAKANMQEAIDAARVVKRQINKLVKSGETAKLVVDEKVLAKVASARTAFLDLEVFGDVEHVEVEAPAIDFEPAMMAITEPVDWNGPLDPVDEDGVEEPVDEDGNPRPLTDSEYYGFDENGERV
jgi:hypothetical protein